MAELTMFGTFPKRRVLGLTTGQDFNLTIRSTPGGVVTNWPAGAALTIVFSNGTTWTATIATSLATFAIPYATADLIDGNGAVTYRMKYTDTSGNDLVPYKGPVIRDDRDGTPS